MNLSKINLLLFAIFISFSSICVVLSEEEYEYSVKNEKEDKTPPPYALSYVYVRYLAKLEENLYEALRNYEQVLKQRLKIVSNYVKDYEESSLKGTLNVKITDENSLEKASVIASHPLMTYRLIKRFSSEIEALGKDLARDVENSLREHVTKLMDGKPWPSKTDHENAMEALLRLAYVYNLDLKDLSSGKINGIETNVGLTAKQTFHIAKFASYANFHTHALDWLGVTSWKVAHEEGAAAEVGANTVALAYKHAIEKHNNEILITNNTGNLYTYVEAINSSVLPERRREIGLKFLHETPKLDIEELEELEDDIQAERAHYEYVSLCNGLNTRNESERTDLYCYYEHNKNPYWIINPVKTEILNTDPPLIQMYDFISNEWMDYLIEKATPISFAPPTPGGRATPRTAAYAWLNDSEIPEVPLSRKIELITGLNVRGEVASTSLQIASYIFGGHVANHVDSLGDDADERGDRVTTFLIYLNDVEAGGYTAFPVLGTFVKPVKGSAILWYDSLKNGEIDNRMLHGACPPIFGHKWIATKWTHLNENMFNRPCDLEPDA